MSQVSSKYKEAKRKATSDLDKSWTPSTAPEMLAMTVS